MSSPTRSGELPGWRHAIQNARYARAATKELSLASSWHRTTEGSRPRGLKRHSRTLAQAGVLSPATERAQYPTTETWEGRSPMQGRTCVGPSLVTAQARCTGGAMSKYEI